MTSDRLGAAHSVIFLNTTGDVLGPTEEAALEEYVAEGGGFVAVHAAADAEYEWPWYEGLIGAYFESHPEVQEARVVVVDSEHPVAAGLPSEIEVLDEWYNFQSQPPDDASIIAVIDENSYEGGAMGEFHPIVWAREYSGGRSVYIGLGHQPELFDNPLLERLLGNAVAWVADDEE